MRHGLNETDFIRDVSRILLLGFYTRLAQDIIINIISEVSFIVSKKIYLNFLHNRKKLVSLP